MSRKKKKRKPRQNRPHAAPRFSIGDAVHVKAGTKDPDYADMPIGGWAGTILEVIPKANSTGYLVEWNERTLAAMHPVYRTRCERDNCDYDAMWLDETELEPDIGEPVSIEQPTNLITRPLRMHDQDDRLRAIFGLTSDDPLPESSERTLSHYHHCLSERLRFPFPAKYEEEVGPFESRQHRIIVEALLPASEGDSDEGLLCTVSEGEERFILRLDAIEASGPNRQLIDDYAYWLNNFQGDDDSEPGFEQRITSVPDGSNELESPWPILPILGWFILYSGLCGTVLGVTLAVRDNAILAIEVGAGVTAVLGCVCGFLFGKFVQIERGIRWGLLLCSFCGLIIGALLGGVLGAMVLAYPGALVGGILGWGRHRIAKTKERVKVLFGTFVWGALGTLALTWWLDGPVGWSGVWIGGLAGIVTGPVLVFALIAIGGKLLLRRRPKSEPFAFVRSASPTRWTPHAG